MLQIPTQIQQTAITLLSFSSHTNTKINEIFNHGCWCSKLNPENSSSNKNKNNKNLGGSSTVDELDLICKQWFVARRCSNTAEGHCWNGIHDEFPEYYDFNEHSGFCESENLCEQEVCGIDNYYLMQIEELFYTDGSGFTEDFVGNNGSYCEVSVGIGGGGSCAPVYLDLTTQTTMIAITTIQQIGESTSQTTMTTTGQTSAQTTMTTTQSSTTQRPTTPSQPTTTTMKTCLPGYNLINKNCEPNTCTCYKGSPTLGAGCETHGSEHCSACPCGYELDATNNTCMEIPESPDLNEVLDVVFIVDGSGSVGQANFDMQINFLKSVTESMDIRQNASRVAFLQYSNVNRIEFGFIDDKVLLKNSFDHVVYKRGGTKTGSAILYAYENIIKPGARLNAKVLMIVVTDGKSHDSVLGPANEMRKNGIVVFAVAYANYQMGQLQEIANDPDDEFVYVGDVPDDLYAKAKNLTEKICDVQDEYGEIDEVNGDDSVSGSSSGFASSSGSGFGIGNGIGNVSGWGSGSGLGSGNSFGSGNGLGSGSASGSSSGSGSLIGSGSESRSGGPRHPGNFAYSSAVVTEKLTLKRTRWLDLDEKVWLTHDSFGDGPNW